MPVSPEQFRSIYPKLIGWIDLQLALNSSSAKPVSSAGFARLGEYYSKAFLSAARFVVTDKVPMPPLSRLGLSQLEVFEKLPANGVAYRQTIFIQREHVGQESLYFHELVHVLQWSILGPEEFVRRYTQELASVGYEKAPLEMMASDAQRRFDSDPESFDVRRYVEEHLKN